MQVRRTLVNWGSGIFASKRSSDAPHAVRVGKDGKIKYVSIIYGKSIDIIYIPAKGLSKYWRMNKILLTFIKLRSTHIGITLALCDLNHTTYEFMYWGHKHIGDICRFFSEQMSIFWYFLNIPTYVSERPSIYYFISSFRYAVFNFYCYRAD